MKRDGDGDRDWVLGDSDRDQEIPLLSCDRQSVLQVKSRSFLRNPQVPLQRRVSRFSASPVKSALHHIPLQIPEAVPNVLMLHSNCAMHPFRFQ